MGNPNKTMRILLRWKHLLVGTFVCTRRDNEAFILLMQVVFVSVVVLTGVWMWQQARIRHLYRRPNRSPRCGGTNGP